MKSANKVLYCEGTIYVSDNEKPSHVIVLAAQMKQDDDDEIIANTEEFHLFYTPEQIREFIADNEMDPESQSELKELIGDLEEAGWRDLSPLHLTGHHAQAMSCLTIAAMSEDDGDDDPEVEEDDSPNKHGGNSHLN